MVLPANFSDICTDSDNDSDTGNEDSLTKEEKQAYQSAWKKALGQPDYTLNRHEPGFFKKTVKYAQDEEGLSYYLKAESSFHNNLVSPQNHAENLAPSLYAGPVIIKRKSIHHLIETKRVSITKDCGPDLSVFLYQEGGLLTDMARDLLAQAIYTSYIEQISQLNIIHTDIKPANICVKSTDNPDKPFEVTFIDFDEALQVPSIANNARGCIPYLAPEFFKTLQGFNKRFENYDDNNALKGDYKPYFCKASDLFALGQVILWSVAPPETSNTYKIAQSLVSLNVEERLKTESDLKNETTYLSGVSQHSMF